MNRELSDVQAGFRKGTGTRDQIANICWIIKKVRELQKSIYFCFSDYAKAFNCVHHNRLENSRVGNTGLDEAQVGIKIAGRNINNLRYVDDTTLRAESEELKSLLMKVKEESEKNGLNLNIHKTKIMAPSPISSWKIYRETVETVRDFILGGAPKSLQMVTAAMKLKDASSLEEKL